MKSKFAAYRDRDELLKKMGFSSYKDYLASDLWGRIRRQVLARSRAVCEVCGVATATQIHHRSYCYAALAGYHNAYLVACCADCHKNAEFAGRSKTTVREANKRMATSALSSGRVLFGLCASCRGNPVGAGKTLCGRCVREGRRPDPRVG